MIIGNWQPPVENLSYRLAMIRADNILFLLQDKKEYILVIQMPECWQAFGIVLRIMHSCPVEKRVLVLRSNGEIVNMSDFMEKEVMAPISERPDNKGEQTPNSNTAEKVV